MVPPFLSPHSPSIAKPCPFPPPGVTDPAPPLLCTVPCLVHAPALLPGPPGAPPAGAVLWYGLPQPDVPNLRLWSHLFLLTPPTPHGLLQLSGKNTDPLYDFPSPDTLHSAFSASCSPLNAHAAWHLPPLWPGGGQQAPLYLARWADVDEARGQSLGLLSGSSSPHGVGGMQETQKQE